MPALAAPPSPPRPVRRFFRAAGYLLLAMVVVVGGAAAWFCYAAISSLPQLEGAIRVPGLGAPVTVLRDAQGVPHIRASNLEDLFFAQGYVTAQDRLWQLDLARRFAAGELAEILGERALPQDREQRILQIRHAAALAAARLGPEERAHLEAYARGVNALIASQQDRLPIEFRLLGYWPRPWTVEDSLLVGANMVKLLNHYQFETELARERVVARAGPQLAADLYPSSSWRDRVPGVLPPTTGVVPKDVQQYEDEEEADPDDMEDGRRVTHAWPLAEPAPPPGSNNWAVSGAHTVSGLPLLANDMHLPHRIPDIWYEAHLQAGDFDVAGVTLPGLPYVIVGHNARIAWGFTNLGPDVEDIFIETFNDRGEYLTPEGWKAPERRREVIHVKGKPDVVLDVLLTRHGPVVTELVPGETRKLALQWSLYDPETFRLPFFSVNRARNWEEFRKAFSRFGAPAQNVVYADVDGHIGYQATGRIPIRRSGDGAVPVSGATRDHDWIGYVPYEELPRVFDPPTGILATANGRVTPDRYPHLLALQWASPYRTERIYRVLESGRRFAGADMLALQTDVLSEWDLFCAQRFAEAVARSPKPSARTQQAAELLRAWDGRVTRDSAAATLVERARRQLTRRLYGPKLGPVQDDYRWFMSAVALENILREQPARWLPPNYPNYDALLVAALEAALSEPEAPRDPATWRWGSQSKVEVSHPLFGLLPILRRWTGTGEHEQSGNGSTVKQVGRSFGPSQRLTVDLSDLDASTLNIVGGQSGQIFSRYYLDQWEAWLEGRTYTLPFTASAVEEAARHRLVLGPAP
ncbi:MAG TPA: penicillin acylase family protein [Terriglobales bacterium]|nr:penicillin acylase family protein [Terriglobales bacterium]